MHTTHPAFPGLYIMQVPTMSTAHITPEDGARLSDPGCVEVLAEITGGFGHIVHFDPETIEDEFSEYSPAFRAILTQLGAAGFTYARFDADHEACPTFPSFDW